MTQNNNLSLNNRSFSPSNKVVLSSKTALNRETESAINSYQAPFVTSTALSTQVIKQNWWQNLNFKNQIALIAVGLSFASASIVGGASYLLPYNSGILLWGSGIAATITGIVTLFFARKYTQAVADANQTINRLNNGNTAVNWGEPQLDELDLLGSNLNQLSSQLQILAEEQEAINRQRQFISSISFRTRQTADLNTLMQTVVKGTRELLDTDRVVVYRFNEDWTGNMIAESVADGFSEIINDAIGDPCFCDRYMEQYQAGRIQAINDLYQEPGLTDYHIRMLEQYQVKANLVVPIRHNNKLMGLLVAHHCRSPRVWQKSDLDFMSQVATEIEYGIDYINFVEQQNQAVKKACFFDDIAFRASQNKKLSSIFQATVKGARDILHTDRVIIYQFGHNWSSTPVAESLDQMYSSLLNETTEDICLKESYLDQYKNGRVVAIQNIRTQPDLTEYQIRTLEQYDIKAILATPIRKDGELMGLIIAHHCATSRAWQPSEIDFWSQLRTQLEYAIDRLSYSEKIQVNIDKAKLFNDIAFRARKSLDEQLIFKVAVQGARNILQTDRILIYRFHPDWTGTIIAESVAESWVKLLKLKIEDPCLEGDYIDFYRSGKIKVINDIYQDPETTDYRLRTLEQYNVKASLAVPIRQNGELHSLLIAHHCAAPRAWQKAEIGFVSELATQIEYALDHISFIEQLQQAKQTAKTASLKQHQQKEAIQHQLDSLVAHIQEALTGNLTVRAQITDGEMATVAKFLNSTLDNLQQVVMQVQSTSSTVIQTVNGAEDNVNTLSVETSRQAKAVTLVLEQIQGITESIHGVADNAQSAKKMVQQANQTLEDGDFTMNRTVDSILTIKETVEEAAQKVKRLGEASQKISRVVNLIRDLANQTHVLALNASIEANGTSGEGQGFAVVAEEVRSLSEQSTAATKEIEQILEEIQTETNQVATAMEAGREQVMAGTNLVETTREHLTLIARVSSQIKQLVEDMAQSATAQSKTSASVFKTMQEVETIAQQTSVKSAASAQSFTRLLEVSEELHQSVTHFKVK